MKIGFRAASPKGRGARNTFDVTPIDSEGVVRPERRLGCRLVEAWGEWDRFQTVGYWASERGGSRDPVEIQEAKLGDDCGEKYILADSTNSAPDSEWDTRGTPQLGDDVYLVPGKRSFCVRYRHMAHYRCQDGMMDDRGYLRGFGTNDRGYDLPAR